MRNLVACMFVASVLLVGCSSGEKAAGDTTEQEQSRKNRELDKGIDLSGAATEIKADSDKKKAAESDKQQQ